MNYLKGNSKNLKYLYCIIIPNDGIGIMKKEHTFEDTLNEVREVAEQAEQDEIRSEKEKYIGLLFNSLSESQWEALAKIMDEDVPMTIHEKSDFLYYKLVKN